MLITQNDVKQFPLFLLICYVLPIRERRGKTFVGTYDAYIYVMSDGIFSLNNIFTLNNRSLSLKKR